MKFSIATMDMAKKAAKSLRRELSKAGRDVPLHESQRLVAAIYGYEDWHALEQAVGKGTPSPVDCSLSSGQLENRLKRQIAVLEGAGMDRETAELILARVQPTGPRLPASGKREGNGAGKDRLLIDLEGICPSDFGPDARIEFYQTVRSLLSNGYSIPDAFEVLERVYQ